ncbi:MAG: hypothetical protein R3F44_14680 [Candidatus Competibacteraceae bacterium]
MNYDSRSPPPANVLRVVSREQLPERLRHFRTRPALEMASAPPLGISFPVAGTTVELSVRDGRFDRIAVGRDRRVRRYAGW